MTGLRPESGSVTTEFALGIGLLVLPVALLVLSIPGWVERRAMATVAAQEAARTVATDLGGSGDLAASQLVEQIAANHGVDPASVELCLSIHTGGTPAPRGCDGAAIVGAGDVVTARVTVQLPALRVPLAGTTLASIAYTASHSEPVDRYRSDP